jgi:hypothetical protein
MMFCIAMSFLSEACTISEFLLGRALPFGVPFLWLRLQAA